MRVQPIAFVRFICVSPRTGPADAGFARFRPVWLFSQTMPASRARARILQMRGSGDRRQADAASIPSEPSLRKDGRVDPHLFEPVSYTHLTLPTSDLV